MSSVWRYKVYLVEHSLQRTFNMHVVVLDDFVFEVWGHGGGIVGSRLACQLAGHVFEAEFKTFLLILTF